jgi:hypothetical protein
MWNVWFSFLRMIKKQNALRIHRVCMPLRFIQLRLSFHSKCDTTAYTLTAKPLTGFWWNVTTGATTEGKKVTRHEGAWGERRYSSYSFSTSALDGGEWLASRPRPCFTPGERTPGTHWAGGWVGHRAGLDAGARRKILCLCRGSNTGCPVRRQTILTELPRLLATRETYR